MKVHQISTSSRRNDPAPSRRAGSNIKRVVQGRSRSINNNGKGREYLTRAHLRFPKERGSSIRLEDLKISSVGPERKNQRLETKRQELRPSDQAEEDRSSRQKKKNKGAAYNASLNTAKKTNTGSTVKPARKPATVRKLGGARPAERKARLRLGA